MHNKDEYPCSTFLWGVDEYERTLREQRERIADYVLDQLLGKGRDQFDVRIAPSVIREVVEVIRHGEVPDPVPQSNHREVG